MATDKKSQPVYWDDGLDETAKDMADLRGLSVSKYLNYLVKQDAEKINNRNEREARRQAQEQAK
jgi:hypothetical protein